jgi:HD-like signal output (HDOD) protein
MDNGARMTTAQSLVENVLQLISLPEIYLRLQQVIDDPDHTREQVAEIGKSKPSARRSAS